MSQKTESFYKRLEQAGVIVIASVDTVEHALSLGDAIAAGGLGGMEIELDTPAALDAAHAVRKAHPEMILGIGRVTTCAQADDAAALGADYVSTASYDESILLHCLECDLPAIPVTVDEGGIFKSGKLGFPVTGIVPANQTGTLDTIDLFADVFKGHRFMPRGGIDAQNMESYLDDPAVIACGVTDWVVIPSALEGGNFSAIGEAARQAGLLLRKAKR